MDILTCFGNGIWHVSFLLGERLRGGDWWDGGFVNGDVGNLGQWGEADSAPQVEARDEPRECGFEMWILDREVDSNGCAGNEMWIWIMNSIPSCLSGRGDSGFGVFCFQSINNYLRVLDSFAWRWRKDILGEGLLADGGFDI